MLKIGTPPEDFEGGGGKTTGQRPMKKWIIFLSVSIIILLLITIANIEIVVNRINVYNEYSSRPTKELIYEFAIVPIIKYSILGFLSLTLAVINAIFLISIILRKISPLSVKDNVAHFKAECAVRKVERKQRQLEKAQAKVEQLQDELEKGD